MKRQLLAGLASGLLGVGCLVAQSQAMTPPQQAPNYVNSRTWQQRMALNGHFTIAGEYFYRRLLETQPFEIVNFEYFLEGPEVRHESGAVETVPVIANIIDPVRTRTHGNFGAAFVQYAYRGCNEPYLALRGRWSSGEIDTHHGHRHFGERREEGDDDVEVDNDIQDYNEVDRPDHPFRPVTYVWDNHAHEWNVEGRFGYTFALGACNQFYFSPYLGVGYEGGRMAVDGFGRQKYWWFYVPVGFLASYEFMSGFGIALDADFGMMADAHYVAIDEPPVNNYERKFGDRYRWELELPLTWTFIGCWSDGQFTLGLVPFWHGWRTRERLQGELPTSFDRVTNGFTKETTDVTMPGPVVVYPDVSSANGSFTSDGEFATFTDLVVTRDQPVTSPRMLNNSWGGRLELTWNF
jgi:hypothetical protein